MQNGGSETDGVRLLTGAASVVDTLLYDDNNSNELEDDSGGIGSSFAVDVAAGHSLARIPDCTDTDDAAADFADVASPTPGAMNVGGSTGGGDADCSVLTVTINEFMPDPASDGGDGGYEWVELYNSGGTAIDLSGWDLINRKSEASSKTVSIPADTIIPAGGWLVLGEEFVAEADVIVDLDMGND
ncbi:MAG: lamin tail domain-containing protein, partial [Anaerolineae bacterium]|nr:lamin tail domain-containing protein [Anaerolineae bacterium]